MRAHQHDRRWVLLETACRFATNSSLVHTGRDSIHASLCKSYFHWQVYLVSRLIFSIISSFMVMLIISG